jgi:hypothetical protein
MGWTRGASPPAVLRGLLLLLCLPLHTSVCEAVAWRGVAARVTGGAAAWELQWQLESSTAGGNRSLAAASSVHVADDAPARRVMFDA